MPLEKNIYILLQSKSKYNLKWQQDLSNDALFVIIQNTKLYKYHYLVKNKNREYKIAALPPVVAAYHLDHGDNLVMELY